MAAMVNPVERGEEELRARHAARFEQLLPEYVARIEWSWDRVREERLRALRELLAVAVARSPWHRKRLAGLDVSAVTDADVAALPVMTKQDLMTNFDAIVTDTRITRELCERHLDGGKGNHLLDEYSVVASAGSSGRRGVFVYGWDAWAVCYASIVRFQERDWLPANLAGRARVTAVVAAASPTHLSAALARTFSTQRSPRRLFPVSEPLEEIVSGLNKLQPDVLMAYSSFLPHLAAEAREAHLRISPRQVIAISEPLLPEVRAAAAATWRAPVVDGYGMSEGLFGGSCPHAIHLPDDLCLVELIDAGGQPARPGTPSERIYVTNLYNHVLPLIRFEVTDELTLLEGDCPCRSGLRRIADPQGRLDETFVYQGGASVHPHVFRSALSHYPEIVEYEVRQTQRGADIRVVSDTDLDTHTLGYTLQGALERVGLSDPRVDVTLVASLARQASGKLKRFVPLSG